MIFFFNTRILEYVKVLIDILFIACRKKEYSGVPAFIEDAIYTIFLIVLNSNFDITFSSIPMRHLNTYFRDLATISI